MKTLLTIALVSTSLLAAVDTTPAPQSNKHTAWVDAQIAAIKPPRKGMSAAKLSRVKNPYLIKYSGTGTKTANASTKTSGTDTKKTVTEKPRKPLKLTAIVNESALIGNKWYSVDDKVQGYKVQKIDKDSVVLQYGQKQRVLMLSAKNPNIKINIK
jgi:hypothetical protein